MKYLPNNNPSFTVMPAKRSKHSRMINPGMFSLKTWGLIFLAGYLGMSLISGLMEVSSGAVYSSKLFQASVPVDQD
jgi:hypothetical protein